MTTYRHLWTLAAGGVVMASFACKDTRETGAVKTTTAEGTSTTPAAETAEVRDIAMVRVVNASPGDKTVTVWAGDSISFADVPYEETSDWREIPKKFFNFTIKNPVKADESLAENRENLQAGRHYTIVALPDMGGSDKRNLRVLDDDLEPVPAEKARIRFINGVAGDFDVDLLVTGLNEPVFDGVNFKSEAGWDEIIPVTGTLIVRPDNEKATLAKRSNVKLEGGKSYTFVFTGSKGKYEILQIEDDVATGTGVNTARERVEQK